MELVIVAVQAAEQKTRRAGMVVGEAEAVALIPVLDANIHEVE
jgi:hypothetical protein